MTRWTPIFARLAITAFVLGILARQVQAQGTIRDGFEGPEPIWADLDGDTPHKIDALRVPQGVHSGHWCERLAVRGNNGTFIYVGYSISPARVIAELIPSVWLKADRPGLQILARVVLPRSMDPRSGKPLTTLIGGSAIKQVDTWQQLRIENLPQLLERQVRVLRTQFGSEVNSREAYVDRIMLNVYGGMGVTNVWIDDLEIAGAVPAGDSAAQEKRRADGPSVKIETLPTTWTGKQGVPKVELRQALLLVDDKPFLPRIVEHRGEPLARLQALGFNAIRVAQVPTSELLREAAGLGLWVVAPPPPPRELEPRGPDAAPMKIGGQFDPVLAWDLGGSLATRELSSTKTWAKLVEAADLRNRPLICDADSDVLQYSRAAKILLARRDPLGSTLQLADYATWLHDRARLARAGTPFWATIQTEPAAQLLEQHSLLSNGQAPPAMLQESQIRAMIRAALAAGVRGLCFQSRSRLDVDDPITRRRAAILELMNLELDLIERWPAAGNFSANADTNEPHVSGAVIETDLTRLLLPIYWPPNSQLAMGNTPQPLLRFVVAGVPEGHNAYELSPANLRPLHPLRGLGGTSVTLRKEERDALIVFTQDPLVMQNLKGRVNKATPRGAQLAREIAVAELVQVDATERRLAALGQALAVTNGPLAAARSSLAECDALLAKKDLPGAYDQARRALQTMREIERRHWDHAMPSAELPLGDPFTANFVTLGEHYRFTHELTTAARSANRLPEGAFEDLTRMLQAGWKHFQHPEEGITTTVDLAPQAAHAGGTGLRLRAVMADPKKKPGPVETPPLWVTSAPVQAELGQILQIQGWVHIAQPLSGSVDGLLVIDSLGGEALAQRLGKTDQWRQFTLYRAANRSGPVAITFALSGLGEAWIDDVTIQVVQRGAPPQQAQRAPGTAAPPRGP